VPINNSAQKNIQVRLNWHVFNMWFYCCVLEQTEQGLRQLQYHRIRLFIYGFDAVCSSDFMASNGRIKKVKGALYRPLGRRGGRGVALPFR
jgi:hypothetical protein